MNTLWQLTITDYLEILQRAKDAGVQPGESIEKYLFEYVQEKGIKPLGNTELTKEEYIDEQVSHGKTCLKIGVDKKGKSTYKIKKSKEK